MIARATLEKSRVIATPSACIASGSTGGGSMTSITRVVRSVTKRIVDHATNPAHRLSTPGHVPREGIGVAEVEHRMGGVVETRRGGDGREPHEENPEPRQPRRVAHQLEERREHEGHREAHPRREEEQRDGGRPRRGLRQPARELHRWIVRRREARCFPQSIPAARSSLVRIGV